MKSVLIVFFAVLLFLLIIILPFKVRLMAHFNLLELKGYYCFKILFIKFLNGRIIEKDGELVMENSVNVMDKSNNKEFMKQLSSEIISTIDVKKVEMFFTGGLVDNSFSSAILCGSVSSFVETIYSYFSQKYDCVKLYKDIVPTFNQDNLELTFDIVLGLSLFGIAKSLIQAHIKTKKIKESKNEG